MSIIGYLAPTGRCGSICTTAHLHFGIRKGHYGDPGFPSGGWGYVPISDTKEFSQWIEPIGFISDREELWRFQPPQTVTINFPWVYNFSTCDLRPIRVRLGNELLFSSAPGDEKLVRTFGKFLWFGTYTLNVEYYDVPKAPPVKIEWPFAPNRLACSAEAIFPTSTPTVTRTPGVTVIPSSLPSPTPKVEEKIAYIGKDGNLWIVALGSNQKKSIDVGGVGIFPPSWSPDGSQIAFTCTSGSQYRLCVVNVDGTGLRYLTPKGGPDYVLPKWHPDGKRIAFEIWERSGQYDIAVVDVSGASLRRFGISGASSPSWSPSGNEIAYFDSTPKNFGLYVSNQGGGVPRFLGKIDGSQPDWSPDGTKIAFACTPVKPPSICIVSLDGVLTKVPTTTSYANWPSWSPNGDRIGFYDGQSIYIMTASGSNVTKTADNAESGPAWYRGARK